MRPHNSTPRAISACSLAISRATAAAAHFSVLRCLLMQQLLQHSNRGFNRVAGELFL